MKGRSLPLPPLAPIVALLGLGFGLLAGFELAPASAPAPSAHATATAMPSPSSVVSPSTPDIAQSTFELPPVDGLTLTQALQSLDAVRISPIVRDVISARIVRSSEVMPSTPASPDSWVWAIVVRMPLPFWCNVGPAFEYGGTPPSYSPTLSCSRITTEMIILDYYTGDFVEARVPAQP